MNNLIKEYFNWEYYTEKYPDIKQHCKTYEDCIWHFCGVKDLRDLDNVNKILNGDGIKEGRLFNKKLEELEGHIYYKYIEENKLETKSKFNVYIHFLNNYDLFKLNQQSEKIIIERINNNNKNVCLILKSTSSIYCGGTKTAIKLLKNVKDINLYYLIINIDNINHSDLIKPIKYHNEQIYNKIIIININNEIIFNFEPDLIISTYNITSYFNNLFNSKNKLYFIQDIEYLFFEKETYFYNLALYSYLNLNHDNIFYGNFIEKNLQNLYKDCYLNFNNINYNTITLGINNNIYYDKKINKEYILLIYYKNKKRRRPDIIEYIANQLINIKNLNYSIISLPDKINNNIKCLGLQSDLELSDIYNKSLLVFCFSDSNISRMSLEINSCNTHICELNNDNYLNNTSYILINKNNFKHDLKKILNINFINSLSTKKNEKIKTIKEENNEILNVINNSLNTKRKKLSKIYILISSGNLGNDYLKGTLLANYLNNNNYECILIPTDYKFNVEYFSECIIRNIKNSIIIFTRCLFLENYDLIKKLKNNNNKLILDPIDLFTEENYFNMIFSKNIFNLFDKVICNSIFNKNYMSKYINIYKLNVIYHHWDPRYNLKLKKNEQTNIVLGFIGCCKRLDQMLNLSTNIIKKYNIKLLDSECWEYVNHKIYNNIYNWDTKNLQFCDIIDINFNVQVSVRNTNNPKLNLFKTNLKISVAALMNQVIIVTKEPVNLELLDETYPFYLNNCSNEEFERVYNILINDFNSTKILYNKALNMLSVVKNKTEPNIIFSNYINLFKFIN